MSAFDYNQGDIHLRYDEARSLPRATLTLWMETLARCLAGVCVETIADVGCGTGRFSFALAEHFAAKVYGVDPSAKMLSVARESQSRSGVEFIEGCAEQLPLDAGVADVVFLSMVYHHIQDKPAACAAFKRVLRPTGRLCIRTSTRELMDSYLWLDFFPDAREIERHRIPSGRDLQTSFESCGFTLVARESVRQIFARDLREYAAKIELRAISSLRAIPDEAFAKGLARLQQHCAAHDDAQPVYEAVELFVFSAGD